MRRGLLVPVCLYANKAGLDMLETTLAALQDITLDKIFRESGQEALNSVQMIMQQGFTILPAGICLSVMENYVSYQRAVAWKVVREGTDVHYLAFAFTNWSFV
ncbi:unnamed protein product [Ilex paraguariensis]|uniref:MEKHLA domain-containing protein n=1 Tax=Ilex paraguariensis TaxID=185542 RepID=A0ABC8TJI4_9AQUA